MKKLTNISTPDYRYDNEPERKSWGDNVLSYF